MTVRSRGPLSNGAGRANRVVEIEADVRARLRSGCESLPRDKFAFLARQIAEVTVKYDDLAHARAVRVRTPPDPAPI